MAAVSSTLGLETGEGLSWHRNAPAWRRWRAGYASQTGPATELLARSAAIRDGMCVLDVASGAGEPALFLAHANPHAQVIASDRASALLDLIHEQAKLRSLTNLSVVQADSQSLPYPEAHFDRVTSRFGIEYSADLAPTLAELRRVLKPGGLLVVVALANPEQPFLAAWLGVLRRHSRLPPAPAELPGPLRLARPGAARTALEQAGFSAIEEQFHRLAWCWPGPPAEVWEAWQELAPDLMDRLFGAIPRAMHAQVHLEILDAFGRGFDGRQVVLDAEVHLATATR